jgi:hypothetical protein
MHRYEMQQNRWQSEVVPNVHPNNRFQSDGLAAAILRISTGYHAVSVYRVNFLHGCG